MQISLRCMNIICECTEVRVQSLILTISQGLFSMHFNTTEEKHHLLYHYANQFPLIFSYEPRKKVNQQQGLMLIDHADAVKKNHQRKHFSIHIQKSFNKEDFHPFILSQQLKVFWTKCPQGLFVLLIIQYELHQLTAVWHDIITRKPLDARKHLFLTCFSVRSFKLKEYASTENNNNKNKTPKYQIFRLG